MDRREARDDPHRRHPGGSDGQRARSGTAKPGNLASAGFTVAKGTYTIALPSGAWIDVVSASGATIASTAHGHNPCTTAKKYVAFALAGGSYTLKLSGIQGPSIKVLLLTGDQTPKGMH